MNICHHQPNLRKVVPTVEFHRIAVPMEVPDLTASFQRDLLQDQPLPLDVLTEECHPTAARMEDKDPTAKFQLNLLDQLLLSVPTEASLHTAVPTEELAPTVSFQLNPHVQRLQPDAPTVEFPRTAALMEVKVRTV